jgi:chloramphenicol-sensitive protein RarD
VAARDPDESAPPPAQIRSNLGVRGGDEPPPAQIRSNLGVRGGDEPPPAQLRSNVGVRGGDKRGLGLALAAYVTWGILPIYFKVLRPVPALEILAHRVAWSALLLAGMLARRGASSFRDPFRRDRLPLLALTTALISTNWLVYIWAVQADRILEASLGYFVTPLVNVLLGVVFLRESLSRLQKVAVALAGAGVAVLVLRTGAFPWVSLVLAASFGLYGLLRKRAAVDSVGGLFGETALLAPAALAYLALRARDGTGAFGTGAAVTSLLAAAGPITAFPLVWFGLALKRLRLSTMGLVQYLTPTSQFLVGVLLYREPFGPAHAAAFACIWASLALYTWDVYARVRSG